jgi:hypothetical protein
VPVLDPVTLCGVVSLLFRVAPGVALLPTSTVPAMLLQSSAAAVSLSFTILGVGLLLLGIGMYVPPFALSSKLEICVRLGMCWCTESFYFIPLGFSLFFLSRESMGPHHCPPTVHCAGFVTLMPNMNTMVSNAAPPTMFGLAQVLKSCSPF